MKSDGLRQYMYEYMIYRSISNAGRLSDSKLMSSAARSIRYKIDEKLNEGGFSISDSNLGISSVLNAINEAVVENLPGSPTLFTPADARSKNYERVFNEFANYVGLARNDANGNKIDAPEIPGGFRLPISPYDPRFSHREAILEAGNDLRFVTEDDLYAFAAGSPAELENIVDGDLELKTFDDEGRAIGAGKIMSLEDGVGLSELKLRMSDKEYSKVKKHILESMRGPGYSSQNRVYDSSKAMSSQGLSRSLAILDYLGDEGLTYSVKTGLPGQVLAHIDGTDIDIRIVDTPENEQYIGRFYGNGMSVHFMTSLTGKDVDHLSHMDITPEDTINLIKVAMGREVTRKDGQGLVGALNVRSVRDRIINDSYRGDNLFSMVYGDAKDAAPGAKVLIQRRNSRNQTAGTVYITDKTVAEEYLRDSIASARSNFENALNVEDLITEFEENRESIEAGEYEPNFVGDATIVSMKRSYWDVLSGKRENLLRSGAAEEEYRELVQNGIELDDPVAKANYQQAMSQLIYSGDSIEQVRQHASDSLDTVFGTFEPHEDFDFALNETVVRRFDPAMVSMYATNATGSWAARRQITDAIRMLEINPDELMGNPENIASIKDNLIQFDSNSAVDMETSTNEFEARMGSIIRSSLERNGINPSTIQIDEQGIVEYRGTRPVSQRFDPSKDVNVVGHIGQIFNPGEFGEITTNFAGSKNYLFVPGYEASIVRQKPGENKSVEERMRLRGYEQQMKDSIEYAIAQHSIAPANVTELGSATELNRVYKNGYVTRHDLDFVEKSTEEGLSQDLRESILLTEGKRVRLSNAIKDGSTINAEYMANRNPNFDPTNDNTLNPYVITGGRDMSSIGIESNGYFDPVLTSDSTNQGIVRFLVDSAQIDENGFIVKGDEDDRTPLMKHPLMESSSFNPWDRQRMTGGNLLTAAAVSKPVGVAMMTFAGWNFDDPMIVTEEFANEYKVRGDDGKLRPLTIGDKISDFSGNKGVISFIADRNMSQERAEELGIAEVIQTFRENPDLDVVMSPFPAVSRFNGGTARELQKEPQAISLPDGRTVDNAIGKSPLIITHKNVRAIFYDEDALADGRGRKASGQIGWAMASKGADGIMREFYGSNSSGVSDTKEYLNVSGLDLSNTGEFGYFAEDGFRDESRKLIELPDLRINVSETKTGNTIKTIDRTMFTEFGQVIGQQGGDLELPFPLEFPTGMEIPVASSDENGPKTWALPVMSAHLRSGQDMVDGGATRHEYTTNYMGVYEAAVKFKFAQERLQDPDLNDRQREKFENDLGNGDLSKSPLVKEAQSKFDSITQDVKTRRFEGKHNVFRDGIMANRLPDSATSVWTSDPRLDINQVSMGTALADSLGVEDGDKVLLWRDPMLRDAGVRYMEVKRDDRLTGIAVNPVMDKSFDGDFDGDSLAVVKLRTKGAQRDAQRYFSVEANLLDKGAPKVTLEDENGVEHECYPLMMHDALDVKVSQHENPKLADDFKNLTIKANQIENDLESGTPMREITKRRSEVTNELSDYYHEAVGDQVGGAILQFGSAQEHMESVIAACIDTGAKGNMKKVMSYAKYAGFEAIERTDEQIAEVLDGYRERGEDVPSLDRVKYEWKDAGHTLHTRQDEIDVQKATAIKSHGTGMAGSYSQRVMKVTRDIAPTAALELTYPVTQAILQAKHDPIEAVARYEAIMSPARELWKGNVLEHVQSDDGSTHWQPKRDNEGKKIKADPETWKEQFMALYTAEDGLNVEINPEHVDTMAKALTGSDGKIMGVEIESSNENPELLEKMSPLDRLAYGGNFDTLKELADEKRNLFESKQSAQFAPAVIRKNMKIEEVNLEAVLKEADITLTTPGVSQPELQELKEQVSISARDTRREFVPRVKESPVVRSTPVKQAAPSKSVEPTKPKPKDDDFDFGL